MFAFAIFIGIYSYSIFALGIFNLLTKGNCIIVTIVWFISLLLFERKKILLFCRKIFRNNFSIKKPFKNSQLLLIFLLVLLMFVNLIGALGPELAFDSLWYHLTLPKLYLLHHSIYSIPGSLLYYSDMPKLGEMFYISALSIGNEITAKVIHYFFGILCCIILYKFARTFFTQFVSILVILIFYQNLVVDTESITAYIDLIRTFFEMLALWSFVEWVQHKRWRYFFLSACMLGFAIATKLLAIGSLFIFSFLIIFVDRERSFKTKFLSLFIFWLIALCISLPWFIFSFIHTGDPVYPFFTPYFTGVQSHVFSLELLNPLHFLMKSWGLFTRAADPISPMYIILLPFIFIYMKKMNPLMKYIFIYVLLSFFYWYTTSSIEGSRLLLPYIPAFTLLCGFVIEQFRKHKNKIFYKVTSITIVVILLISIVYRLGANIRYVPVLIGKESKSQFLSTHLNFSFGDFYDTDGYFVNHIKSSDTVLLYGFHNLYYVDFPFIDNSWVKKGDSFDYIAIQKTHLPAKFRNWQLIYMNDKTMVQLYKPPKGECQKTCYY